MGGGGGGGLLVMANIFMVIGGDFSVGLIFSPIWIGRKQMFLPVFWYTIALSIVMMLSQNTLVVMVKNLKIFVFPLYQQAISDFLL